MEIFERLRSAVKHTEKLPYLVSRRVAYVVSHAYPFSSNGYAVRTHGIAQGLQKHGYSVVVFNRPGRPWDLEGFSAEDVDRQYEIDKVRYLFFRRPSTNESSKEEYLSATAEGLKEAFRVFKPIAVIAASDWNNALPAALAARELGLPFYYEVRGFWELSRAARYPGYEQTQAFRDYIARDVEVASSANAVFTLNRFMKAELSSRGLDKEKVEVISNGYGELPVAEAGGGEEVRKSLAITERYVLGYVGSFAPYEGLDDLIGACAVLRSRGVDACVLLVGSSSPVARRAYEGSSRDLSIEYQRLAASYNISSHVYMTGRVDPGELAAYYDLIDLFVIPRKNVAVSELVSPVKPIEALAHGKLVLTSDVPPLAELAKHVCTLQTFHSGDFVDLARKSADLLGTADPDLSREARQQSQRFVDENHRWHSVVGPLVSVLTKLELQHQWYEKLSQRSSGAAVPRRDERLNAVHQT
mgnify:CR=1 FL=1